VGSERPRRADGASPSAAASTLELTRSVYDAVVDAALDGAPAEVCGVLAGAHGESRSRAETVHPVANVADRPRVRYELDPEALLAVVESVEAAGRDVVGFYHSHPTGPPAPSETDVARATWRGYSYVICALDGHPFVGSWRWRGEDFAVEPVALVG
jgi:proteasome lid subunit RPN8/RPN11